MSHNDEQIQFQRKLRERILSNPLVQEIDLSGLIQPTEPQAGERAPTNPPARTATPLPWSVANNWIMRRHPSMDIRIAVCDAYTTPKGVSDPRDRANAAHIVNCVNQHDNLVAALRAAISYIEDDSRSPRRRQACLSDFRSLLNAATGEKGGE